MKNVLNVLNALINNRGYVSVDGVQSLFIQTISLVCTNDGLGKVVVGTGVFKGHEIAFNEKNGWVYISSDIYDKPFISDLTPHQQYNLYQALDHLMLIGLEPNGWDMLSNLIKEMR